jgi:hypothetical protein
LSFISSNSEHQKGFLLGTVEEKQKAGFKKVNAVSNCQTGHNIPSVYVIYILLNLDISTAYLMKLFCNLTSDLPLK